MLSSLEFQSTGKTSFLYIKNNHIKYQIFFGLTEEAQHNLTIGAVLLLVIFTFCSFIFVKRMPTELCDSIYMFIFVCRPNHCDRHLGKINPPV